MRFAAKPPILKAKGPAAAPQYRVLQRVANRLTPIAQGSIKAGFTAFKRRIDLELVVDAVRRGDFRSVEDMIPFSQLGGDLDELQALIRQGTVQSAETSATFFKRAIRGLLPAAAADQFSFSPNNPRIATFIARRTATLVTRVTQQGRESIREVIRVGLAVGMPPREMAAVMPEAIGLNRIQAGAVTNFRNQLLNERTPGTALQQRFARRAERTSIDEAVQAYADKQFQLRANAIARTEMQTAVNRGQLEVWDQAAEAGLFNRGIAEKEWVVTEDDRLCPICEPLAGVRVPLDQQFDVEGAALDAAPAHVSCRCHVAIVFGEIE